MKILDALNAFHAIQTLINNPAPKSAKFSYALIKNSRLLDVFVWQHTETLKQQRKDPMFEELLQCWREAATAFGEIQENGDLRRDDAGNIIIPASRVIEYNLVCEEILLKRRDYQEAFERCEAAIARLHQIEVEVTPYPIPLSLFPAETDHQLINALYAFIDGEN